jgi:hypothetical protein
MTALSGLRQTDKTTFEVLFLKAKQNMPTGLATPNKYLLLAFFSI